jgi:hypothetical protein
MPSSRYTNRSRAGVTLLESVIALAVMTVAVSLFSSMVVSTSKQRVLNHEFPTASEGVRETLERMRNEDFDKVYALYNADPLDDPLGAGTAPGHRFAIAGLEALEGVGDGFVGEIRFPTVVNAGALELREDSVDSTLGMPRDLNGDSIVDDQSHADDYILLPICVVVDWQGRHGPRHIEFFTMFADLRK